MKSIGRYTTIDDYHTNGKREIWPIDHRMYEQQQQAIVEIEEEQN
jgi:hypothetical protein